MVEGDVNFEITALARRVPAYCPTASNILGNVLILYLNVFELLESVSPPWAWNL